MSLDPWSLLNSDFGMCHKCRKEIVMTIKGSHPLGKGRI